MDVTDTSNVTFPCVLLTCEGEREEDIGGTTLMNQYWRPVRMFLADRQSFRNQKRQARIKWWRNVLINLFAKQALKENIDPTVVTVSGCEVSPDVIYDPKQAQYQDVVTACLFKFFCCEVRPYRVGIGP
jgi:hypothetical protein